MEYYCGIEVSLEQSRVCVVDAEGSIVREAAVVSDPDTLIALVFKSWSAAVQDRLGGRAAVAVAVCWRGQGRSRC